MSDRPVHKRPSALTNLIVAAGLWKQYTCMICGVLLEAFGRDESKWVCPDHEEYATDGVTCACKSEAIAHD